MDLKTIVEGHLLTQTTPDAPDETHFHPEAQDTAGLGMDDVELNQTFEDLDSAFQVNESLEMLLDNLQRYSAEGMNEQATSFAKLHFNHLRKSCGQDILSLESTDVASLESNVADFIAQVKEMIQKILKKIVAAFTHNAVLAEKKIRGIEERAKELATKNKEKGSRGGPIGLIKFHRMGWFAKDGHVLSSFNIVHELQQSMAYVNILTSALEGSLEKWEHDPAIAKIFRKTDTKDGVEEFVSAPFAGNFEVVVRLPEYNPGYFEKNHGAATSSLAKAAIRPMRSHTDDSQLEQGVTRLYSDDRMRLCEGVLSIARESSAMSKRVQRLNKLVEARQSEIFKNIGEEKGTRDSMRNLIWGVSNGIKVHMHAIQILHGYLMQYMLLCLRYVSESMEQVTEKEKEEA